MEKKRGERKVARTTMERLSRKSEGKKEKSKRE